MARRRRGTPATARMAPRCLPATAGVSRRSWKSRRSRPQDFESGAGNLPGDTPPPWQSPLAHRESRRKECPWCRATFAPTRESRRKRDRRAGVIAKMPPPGRAPEPVDAPPWSAAAVAHPPPLPTAVPDPPRAPSRSTPAGLVPGRQPAPTTDAIDQLHASDATATHVEADRLDVVLATVAPAARKRFGRPPGTAWHHPSGRRNTPRHPANPYYATWETPG